MSQLWSCGRLPRLRFATDASSRWSQSGLHYCDYQIPTPPVCPSCKFDGIHYGGLGTQRLEVEVQQRFRKPRWPAWIATRCVGPGSHERVLGQFRSGELQILLGTQMIAKGLDFPNVLLVGVINADSALHFPDFRASERTFQLVTQVAGRTGRGESPAEYSCNLIRLNIQRSSPLASTIFELRQ